MAPYNSNYHSHKQLFFPKLFMCFTETHQFSLIPGSVRSEMPHHKKLHNKSCITILFALFKEKLTLHTSDKTLCRWVCIGLGFGRDKQHKEGRNKRLSSEQWRERYGEQRRGRLGTKTNFSTPQEFQLPSPTSPSMQWREHGWCRLKNLLSVWVYPSGEDTCSSACWDVVQADACCLYLTLRSF